MVIFGKMCYNMYSAKNGCYMDKKIVKDIKRFSLIANTALTIAVTIFMGLGLGMLLDYLFDKKCWTPICSVAFTFIAIAYFIKIIIGITKIDEKKNK